MTKRDKRGLVILLALLAVMMGLLVLTMRRPSGTPGTFDNNAIINRSVNIHTR